MQEYMNKVQHSFFIGKAKARNFIQNCCKNLGGGERLTSPKDPSFQN